MVPLLESRYISFTNSVMKSDWGATGGLVTLSLSNASLTGFEGCATGAAGAVVVGGGEALSAIV